MVLYAVEYRQPRMPTRARNERRSDLLVCAGQRPHCHWCDCPLTKPHSTRHSSLTVDHVMDLARGGSNELSNLVLACRECNELRARPGAGSVD